MSRVAEQLRNAREARNLTVEQVAEITKMRTDHVRALEEGNYNAFSAPVYVRGFVRTYCRLLKLDEGAVLSALAEELGRGEELEVEAGGGSHSKGVVDLVMLQLSKLDLRKSLIGLVIAVVLTILVAGVVIWSRGRSDDPLKNLEPGVYKPATNLVEILPPRGRKPRCIGEFRR